MAATVAIAGRRWGCRIRLYGSPFSASTKRSKAPNAAFQEFHDPFFDHPAVAIRRRREIDMMRVFVARVLPPLLTIHPAHCFPPV
jgi:hypothetical protein